MSKKKLVVLTGAGVSAESGLKTFRDSDGLWEGYNIEDVATPRAWRKDPKLVLDFYNYRRKNVLDAQPNAAHYGLAELERDFELIYEIKEDIKIGDKAEDGEQLRPYIVWFEEPVPKIEEAIPVVRRADIFVVVGTSLVVYPAAGLVNYAARHIPKYIIDKRIPYTSEITNVTAIEKPATEGVVLLS